MIAEAKITGFFCVIDEFNKNFDKEMSNPVLISSSGKQKRKGKGFMQESSESELITELWIPIVKY